MLATSGIAQAQLFPSSAGLDPSFCKTKAVRQTVVYVDDMLMIDGKTDWAQRLVSKLKASLSPGERTTVVQLSPATGSSSEIWSACWPAFTPEQRLEVANAGPYLLKKNPLDQLEQQQVFFTRDFAAAVSKIYFATKRPAGAVSFSQDKPPQKQILRALVSDEGRFSNSAMTVRAIVYSDMAENSDLGSVFKPLPDKPLNYAEKLGTHLRKSVFYAFGVGESVVGRESMQESAKLFWTNAFKMMSANVGGFGTDLNVPNGIPLKSWPYVLTLKLGEQEVDGRLSVLTDSDGNIVDSWMGFNRLSVTGLTGTFRCTNSACKLEGTTTSGLSTTSDTESVVLSGKPERLTGELGVKGTKNMFPMTASQPTNR